MFSLSSSSTPCWIWCFGSFLFGLVLFSSSSCFSLTLFHLSPPLQCSFSFISCKRLDSRLLPENNRLQVFRTNTENHRPGLLWKSITASFFVKGILDFLLNAEITRPRGLTEEARERRLEPILNEVAERRVMLYDTATQRAWLVPTISTILLMVRVHVREDPSMLDKLPPATPSWDAAQEAMAVIRAK